MTFLSNILREEGGFEYKRAIVDSIVTIIRDIPDAKESGLLHLCEFIEDCEFTYLSTQVNYLSIICLWLLLKTAYVVLKCVLSHRSFIFWEMRGLTPQIQASIYDIFTIVCISKMPLSGLLLFPHLQSLGLWLNP